jgi:hypothetical protein
MQTTTPKTSLFAPLARSLLLASCTVRRGSSEPSGNSAAAPKDAVFMDLVQFSDITTLRIQVATRDFTQASKDPNAKLQAATWRLESQRYLTQTTGEPNSTIAMLDIG